MAAGVERVFKVFAGFTRVTRLKVTKLEKGMRIQLRCSGKGCPKELRKGKVRKVSIEKSGSKDFTKLFKGAKLKPKAVIDVRVLQTGAIGRVDRFVIRTGKLPGASSAHPVRQDQAGEVLMRYDGQSVGLDPFRAGAGSVQPRCAHSSLPSRQP